MRLYVIAEASNGPCKLGIANDPRQRLAMLQSGNPRLLTIYYDKEISLASPLETERVAHALIGEAYRMKGEWFSVTVDEARRVVDEACMMMSQHEVMQEIDYPMPKPMIDKIKCKPASDVFLARRTPRERRRLA